MSGVGMAAEVPGHPQQEGRGSHLAFLVSSGASVPLPCHCLLRSHKSSALKSPCPQATQTSCELCPSPAPQASPGCLPKALMGQGLAARVRPRCPPHPTAECVRLVAPAMQMPPQRGLPPPRRDWTLRSSSSGKDRPAVTTEDQRGLRGPHRQGRGAAAGGGGGSQCPGLQAGQQEVALQGDEAGKGAPPQSALPTLLGQATSSTARAP